MTKVIATFNMTLDGVCDHTAGIPDEELHQYYSDLLNNGSVILYGRTTYQLMQFWQTLLQKPSGEKSMDEFAISIDKIKKIVFSNTLKETGWNSAELATRTPEEELIKLKKQTRNDIFIGSRSLITRLLNNELIDELQICIHPVIEGSGMRLFDKIKEKIMLKLIKTKTFKSGTTILYYEPIKKTH